MLSQIQNVEKLVAMFQKSGSKTLDLSGQGIITVQNLSPLNSRAIKLENLYLHNNRIQTLQFCPLVYLQELDLHGNCLAQVTANFPFPQLRVLNLSRNQIRFIRSQLPAVLKRLLLHGNEFSDDSMRAALLQLQQGTEVSIYENKLRSPRGLQAQFPQLIFMERDDEEASGSVVSSVPDEERFEASGGSWRGDSPDVSVSAPAVSLREVPTLQIQQQPPQKQSQPVCLSQPAQEPKTLEITLMRSQGSSVQPVSQQTISPAQNQPVQVQEQRLKLPPRASIPAKIEPNPQWSSTVKAENPDQSLIGKAYEELIKTYEKASAVGFPNPMSTAQLGAVRRALFQLAYDKEAHKKELKAARRETDALKDEVQKLTLQLQIQGKLSEQIDALEQQNFALQEETALWQQRYNSSQRRLSEFQQSVSRAVTGFQLGKGADVDGQATRVLRSLKRLEERVLGAEAKLRQKKANTVQLKTQAVQADGAAEVALANAGMQTEEVTRTAKATQADEQIIQQIPKSAPESAPQLRVEQLQKQPCATKEAPRQPAQTKGDLSTFKPFPVESTLSPPAPQRQPQTKDALMVELANLKLSPAPVKACDSVMEIARKYENPLASFDPAQIQFLFK